MVNTTVSIVTLKIPTGCEKVVSHLGPAHPRVVGVVVVIVVTSEM